MSTSTTWLAWIVYYDQHGGDTTVEAVDAGAALSKAMEWARRGRYDAGDKVEVNVMREAAFSGRLEPEVGTIITIE